MCLKIWYTLHLWPFSMDNDSQWWTSGLRGEPFFRHPWRVVSIPSGSQLAGKICRLEKKMVSKNGCRYLILQQIGLKSRLPNSLEAHPWDIPHWVSLRNEALLRLPSEASVIDRRSPNVVILGGKMMIIHWNWGSSFSGKPKKWLWPAGRYLH